MLFVIWMRACLRRESRCGHLYALGAHTASLGLTITADSGLPPPFTTGAFIGQHGSWNRRPPSGYRVIFVPFVDSRPQSQPVDVLTGFLDAKGQAHGRPVGVALDHRGGLLVADDAATASGASPVHCHEVEATRLVVVTKGGSRTFKVMQRDLRRAVEPHSNNG